jgi:methylmalonyl-CoA mutase C-terminal domain/subunit
MQRKLRVLVAKPGLDGHDRGAKVVAAALRDAGMEVIYTGLHQTPAQVVEAAVQEDVDVVALSILSGAHMTLFPEVLGLMKQRGIGDRLLSGGGIVPPEDMETLAKMGVGRLFGPGSSTRDIAQYIRDWFRETHGEEAFVAVPPGAGEAWPTDPTAATPRRAKAPAAKRAVRKPARTKKAPAAKRVARKPARAKKARVARRAARKPARAARPGSRARAGARKRR